MRPRAPQCGRLDISMPKRALALVVLIASIASASELTPIGTWHSRAGEYADMCMTFFENGTLRFSVGFTHYNPSRWKYHENAGEVTIVLGGKANFLAEVAQFQLEHRPKTIVRFDPKKRELVYPLNQNTKSIDFGGFIYYREPCK